MESRHVQFDSISYKASSHEVLNTLSEDQAELELTVEAAEEVIAPGGGWWPNHNEAELEAEEAESVIAPGGGWFPNHNEAELEAEEAESVIAPGARVNHSETQIG